MALEIERKFLTVSDRWKTLAEGITYRQGYLSSVKERTVRVRTVETRGFLTVKGASHGAVRVEFEYEIPLVDACQMLDHLCEKPLIEKIRRKITHSGLVWEVDEFLGENQGLVVAEVELATEDQAVTLPDWVGVEVTHDARYFNSNLARTPYSRW